jgi:hypothetical protein
MILLSANFSTSIKAQYAPPAGQPGSTAIHADSNIFIDWAFECIVERGLANISDPSLGQVSFGFEEQGTAKADNGVVSLGDGGIATLNFSVPLSDGDGWDFAVFENSFSDDFLELAFVEISSNGVDYYRFNAISETQQEVQIETYGVMDTRKVHNLAGKYSVLYGTPFDLFEMKDETGLDVTNIISIRVIDVVGCIDPEYATYDSDGIIINDPWPTAFEPGGFDLDAVGVIHNQNNTSVNEIVKNANCIIFPNPVTDFFKIKSTEKISNVVITDISGKSMLEFVNPVNNYFDAQLLPVGIYIVDLVSESGLYTVKLIKR